MKRYNPKDIEPKWQQQWAEAKAFAAQDDASKPKKYILEYFPYPSGAAMHVGHVRNYAIGDAIARHARMRGYNVLHPMGWDAFGLPAENYAIKTGVSPQQAIAENTAKFKRQLTQMGFGYDWDREINSSDPEYYKWTQWFFLLLFKRGLAYRKESLQWWCPVDKTVLANEQVEAGVCWRCGSPVEKKALPQWFFKITDYADRLAKDLDDVNWSDALKSMQRNWIGRSAGAEINFAVAGTDQAVRVFTTRPDTLFGATFLVLAPEHPLVQRITTSDRQADVAAYSKQAQAKSEVERQETGREKTGVFTGAYAINPINDEHIPIWIADYVLSGYGTGAIMAVPAHDDRDFAFARTFDLEIREVIAPEYGEKREQEEWADGTTVIVYDQSTDRYLGLDWSGGWTGLVAGGLEDGEAYEACARRELQEEAGITDVAALTPLAGPVFAHYAHPVKGMNRLARTQGYLAVVSSRQGEATHHEPHETFTTNWYTADELRARLAQRDGTQHWQALLERAIAAARAHQNGQMYQPEGVIAKEGVMINSGPYNGRSSSDVREQIVADLEAKGHGKEHVNYKIRDWLISRQRYWGAPIPIIHCPKDGPVAVPEDQLPVVLPDMQSFEPSGDGRSPLARVPEFVHTTCPTCGGPAERETDTMDGFACSSWYFLRYADPHNQVAAFGADKAAYWMPVDDYIGGAEHAVMHLLYVRFWFKVMQDAGLIDFNEPIKTLRNHGMILAPDGAKMSKSKGNTIEPDGLIEQGYGADAIRIMELFIGPWNQAANWSVEGMGGAFRFLQRVWALNQEYLNRPEATAGEIVDDTALKRVTHQAIKRVSRDLDEMGFNTAIAGLMEAVNELYKLKLQLPYQQAPEAWGWTLQTLLQLVAPFAPHIAEELWSQHGRPGFIHHSTWPVYDEQYLASDTMTIVVQINGKVRTQLRLSADVTESTVLDAAESDEKIASLIAGKTVKKRIYVPGKLVSLVVQ